MSLDSNHSDRGLSHEGNPTMDKMEDNPLKLIKCLAVLAICLFAFHAQAEIYKYVDEEGNYHFTDDFKFWIVINVDLLCLEKYLWKLNVM